jgi:glutamate-1-semialdehyde 2,1-aminomutase
MSAAPSPTSITIDLQMTDQTLHVRNRYCLSRAQNERASRPLAGGVATAFRANQLPVPITFNHGRGSRFWDIDGNEYINYALAFGPMILGHSSEPVVAAVDDQIHTGIRFGAAPRLEAKLSEAICRTVPCAQACVFNSFGSEAVYSAIRIARAATDRGRIVKFRAHYHGWFDPPFNTFEAVHDSADLELRRSAVRRAAVRVVSRRGHSDAA